VALSGGGVSCSVREMNEIIMAIVGANLKSCVLSRQWGASMLFVEMELCLPMLLYAPFLFSHLVLCESMCWVGFRCRESRQSQGKTEDLNQGLDCAKADENSNLSLLQIAPNISCPLCNQVRVLSGCHLFFCGHNVAFEPLVKASLIFLLLLLLIPDETGSRVRWGDSNLSIIELLVFPLLPEM